MAPLSPSGYYLYQATIAQTHTSRKNVEKEGDQKTPKQRHQNERNYPPGQGPEKIFKLLRVRRFHFDHTRCFAYL